MRATPFIATTVTLALALAAAPATVRAQQVQEGGYADRDSTITQLVGRLSLDRYKATIKGLTNFGDRRQGTARNRKAVDWIEAQLKSYGCSDVQRLTYTFTPRPRMARGAFRGRGAGRGRGRGPSEIASGGGRYRGLRARTGVNTDSLKQPDPAIRAMDTEQTPDTAGERQEVYCTKVGTTHPDEMYIVGGHMDGIGWGQAANDDGSGAALVMELARVFSSPDVKTDRSIRFVLWNNEEIGAERQPRLRGAAGAAAGQGRSCRARASIRNPSGSGMIQHDMMLWDHGMPRADGTVSKQQRPEADVNIEFQSNSKMAAESEKLAWVFEDANEKYATVYPAQVGRHMTNTDSDPFKDLVPAISLRENERGTQIGAGWDPNWHQPTDVYTTYNDKDFMLGLNAAQTTLGAVAELTGATIKK